MPHKILPRYATVKVFWIDSFFYFMFFKIQLASGKGETSIMAYATASVKRDVFLLAPLAKTFTHPGTYNQKYFIS